MSDTDKVFDEIALSLSGGGYRAAAFHLGTMELLERLGLLKSVRFLSTVSGGTITGVVYAVAIAEGKSFAEFRNQFYKFLQEKNVVKIALSQIGESVQINQFDAMPSLIRASAQVYSSDDLLGNKTFELLFNESCASLEELAFNATDFRTGNCFRFQKSSNHRVRTGNNKAKVNSKVNSMIRLADIVAASSCFPSGFEPIRFPSDFRWNSDLEIIRKELGEAFHTDVPLMDGGVFDNQGIDSIENIFKRKDREIKLYIISDTDRRNKEFFAFPPKPRKGYLTLKALYSLIQILFITSILTLTAITIDAINSITNQNLTWFRGVFLYFVPFVFSLLVIFLMLRGRLFFIEAEKRVFEVTDIKLWQFLKNLTIPEIIELANSRITSLITMASSIFMKRIRDLGYRRIFANPNFERKVIPNLIYDLDNESKWGKEIISKDLEPKERLRNISRQAELYSTNLWFLNKEELDNLIFCGQATICFKLLKHLLRNHKTEMEGAPEAKLYKEVIKIWEELNI